MIPPDHTAPPADRLNIPINITWIDSDSDGLPDSWEEMMGLDPNNPDTDGDGILDPDEDLDADGVNNLYEYTYGSDPLVPDVGGDSDGDGIPDLCELQLTTNPTDPNDPPDPNLDSDNDGLTDAYEVCIYGTDPSYYDSDFDGLPDGWEVANCLDPANNDTDGDGIEDPFDDDDNDGLINLDEWLYGTDPQNPDTDGDGTSDGDEADQGSNPNDPTDGGQAPPPEDLIEVTLTIGDHSGSHSERWLLKVGYTGLAAPGYGQVVTGTRKLRRGASYEITVVHLGTNLPEGPDYDYTAHVTPEPGACAIVDDAQNLLGVVNNTNPPPNQNSAAGKVATLILPGVEILDAAHNKTDTLKVAKWESAFQGSPPVLQANFIDQDTDRFFVRVTDESKKGAGTVTIRLSTDSPGTDYDDDPSLVDLTETGQDSGIFESESLLLVADDVDDDQPVNGVNDDAQNDRTHKIALEGIVRVEYSCPGAQVVFAQADVPVQKTINVHVTILKNGSTVLIGEPFVDLNNNGTHDASEVYRDVDGNGAYTANLSQAAAQARVQDDFKVARERYAQVGIELEISIQIQQAPASINDGLIEISTSPVNGDANLTPDEQALLQAGFHSAPDNDIEVYYIATAKAVLPGGNIVYPKGVAFVPNCYQNLTIADANDSLMLPNPAEFYTFPHEVLHILLQTSVHHNSELNLFYAFSNDIVREQDAQVTDAKRMNPTQESTAQSSAYAQ